MKSEWRERLRELFTDNIELKLLSVVLALACFYAVRGAIGNLQAMTVPVELDVEGDRLAVLNVDPLTVRVTFRGALSELRLLSEQELAAVVRPKPVTGAGWEHITIRSRDIRGRRGRVASIEPSVVRVTYDQQTERDLPVAEPTVFGRPLRGRVEIEYEPTEVLVRGAARQLDRLISDHVLLQTEPIDVEGRVQSFTRRVRVLPPEDTWLTSISPQEITVRVSIVTETIARELQNIPISVALTPFGVLRPSVHPPEAVVRVAGRPDAVQRLSEDTVMVFIDGRGLREESDVEAPLKVYLPPGLVFESVHVEPRTARLDWTAPVSPDPADEREPLQNDASR